MATGSSRSVVSNKNSVSQSAFKVSVGGLLSLLAGLASQVVVAALFGTGLEMDAYLTALVVPGYLQAVLLAGLPFVFIPAFVREQTAGSEETAWSLAGTFFWLTAGLLTLVALLGAISADSIIALTAPGLSTAKADLSARMLAVLMWSVPLTGLGSLTTGIQNARNRFLWPAAAGAVSSLGNAASLLILYRPLGPMALAWGYVISEVLRATVTVLPVLRRGWTKLIPLRDERVREMAKLMAPLIFFGVITRSTLVFERFFASVLPTGDLSYLGYAQKVAKIAMALLGAGIVTAIFPTMARAYTEDGPSGLVEELEQGLRLSLAVSLPALAVMSALAIPLVTVLFERGAFAASATEGVAQILSIVVLGAVVFQIIGNLLSRTYYVTKDTHTVPIVSAVTSVLYILLARWLTNGWGYVGLALAQPLYSGLAIVILIGLLIRKLPSIGSLQLLRDTMKYGAASVAAFFAARLSSGAVSFLPALVQVLVGMMVAGLLYIVLLLWMDRDVAVSILEMTGLQRLLTALKKVSSPLRHKLVLRRVRYTYTADGYRRPAQESHTLFILLLAAALLTDLLMPYLIWKGIAPAPLRWISHMAVAGIMVGAFVRMMLQDRVPPVVLVILGISLIGVVFALLQGQAITPTLWGWWILFQYPFVGLYAYLVPVWPERFPQRLTMVLTIMLTLQVVVQIGQYVAGQPVGDHLAGMFGRFGTAKLVVFILLTLCLALGEWLTHQNWKQLVWVLVMGSISSALGAMKLFPFAASALGALAVAALVLQGRHRWRLVPYAVLVGAVVWAFFGLYDTVVLRSRASTPLAAFLDLETLSDYLGGATSYEAGGEVYYDIGRNYALSYGWNSLRRDAATLLVGLGLGARGESRTLGTAGVGLQRGSLGLSSGTSLLVMMQELGVLGLIAIGGFMLWTVFRLFRDIRRNPRSEATALRYGLLLFSLLWPLWLWYGTVWTFRLSMLIYWVALGYVLGLAHREPVADRGSRLDDLSLQHMTR